VMRNNAEFDVMEELVYRLNVYQTGHLDFCQSNPARLDRCWEYPHPNMPSISQASSLGLRVKMLTKVLLGQSVLLSDLVASGGGLEEQGVAMHDPRVLTYLEKDLVQEPGGQFYFAHVLLPHGPFAFMHDCSINYETPMWARYAFEKGEPIRSDEVYEIRTMKYFEQVDCAVNSLRQLFEGMKKAGVFERAIIVVHGDHGSMIGKYPPKYMNLELLTPPEYRAKFSTLFAVKFPGQDGQVHNDVLALSALLEAFSLTVQRFVANPQNPVGFSQNLPNEQEKLDPYVYLLGQNPLLRVDVNIFED